MIEVYTDGACSGNPGPGGWAWAVRGGPQDSGGELETTNQRMELRAALEAIRSLERPLRVISDSTYVVNCFRDKWYEGWHRRGWKNTSNKPVANRDLWEPLVTEHLKGDIEWKWVKGHSGDPMNDLVDELAVQETARVKEVLANPRLPEIDPPWPMESALVIGGAAELDSEQVESLRSVLAGLDSASDIVISGLRRGAELIGAEICLAQRVPLGVVLPFADPAASWPDDERQRFDTVFAASRWQVDLGANPAQPGTAIKIRNAWLPSACVGAIVVGDAELAAALDKAGLSVVEI